MERITKEPGVYKDVPFEEYVAWDAVNNSSMGAALKSPAHYFYRKPLADSAALRIGRLVHCGRLEPHLLPEMYAVMPDYANQVRTDSGEVPKNPRATKQYKELVEKFETDNSDKEIVSQEEYNLMLGLVTSLHTKNAGTRWLHGTGDYEVSVVAEDPVTGLLCKCRIDFQRYDDVLVDLKTTADASNFARSILNYEYHRQAAFYLDVVSWASGRTFSDFVLVAAEKEPPYPIRGAPVSDAMLTEGRARYRACLNAIATFDKKTAPSYNSPAEWQLPNEPVRISINGLVKELT